MTHALLRERVIAVTPTLVRTFGPGSAMVLQQIHFEASEREGWARMTYAEWSDIVGLTEQTVRRAIAKLEESGAVESRQERKYDRTKSYRPRYARIVEIIELSHPTDGQARSTVPLADLGGSKRAESTDLPLSQTVEESPTRAVVSHPDEAEPVDDVIDRSESSQRAAGLKDTLRRTRSTP